VKQINSLVSERKETAKKVQDLQQKLIAKESKPIIFAEVLPVLDIKRNPIQIKN